LFGRTRRILLGKHSGMAAVTNALASLGVTADESRARRVLDEFEHMRLLSRGRSVILSCWNSTPRQRRKNRRDPQRPLLD